MLPKASYLTSWLGGPPGLMESPPMTLPGVSVIWAPAGEARASANTPAAQSGHERIDCMEFSPLG